MYKKLLFEEIGKVGIREYELDTELKDNEILVKTLYSGISSGTERAIFRGTAPFYDKYFDADLHLFLKGNNPSFQYPVEYGYENVGIVEKIGKKVTEFTVGDKIASFMGHVSHYIVKADELNKLPENFDPKNGVFMALVGVAYNGILDARIVLGDTVVIFGAGIVGQILAQMAVMSGAGEVIVVDRSDMRLELAGTSGATCTINSANEEDVALKIRQMTDRRGADIVIEATGSSYALNDAIRTACFQGRVVVVSFLAGEAKGLFLGDEFHHNRISLVSSQAAGVNPELSPRWTPLRKRSAAFDILPKLKLDHLISHEYNLSQAQEAYELCDHQPDKVMQLIFKF